MPEYSAIPDSNWIFLPWPPDDEGSCYLYPRYAVVAWRSPDITETLAIVRERDPADSVRSSDCSPDSLPGDFLIPHEGTEYFCGMWGDLVLIDSGTGSVRSLFMYDVPSRREALAIHGYEGSAGWIDNTTIRIWVLSGSNLSRSLCPDIPDVFQVGVDSLFALNLKTLSMRALGPWRCNALQ